MKIMHYPVARLVLFFVCGILTARVVLMDLGNLIVTVALLLPVVLSCYLLSLKYHRLQLGFGILTALYGFLLGITTQHLHSDRYRSDHYLNFTADTESSTLELELREQYKTTAKNERYVANVRKINGCPSQGLLLLNLKKDTLPRALEIGSVLHLQSTVIVHQQPLNPGQFDYGRYLQNKNIEAQVFCGRNEIRVQTVQTSIWHYAARLRNTMLSNLRKSGFREQELNVLAALILGQQQDISKEILRDYQYAGAVHILSVSGLHVGLILLFINFMLRPLPNTQLGSLLKIAILLASLWGFAILAGLSPSVVRSVTMFSFVAIGMHLRRSTNIFHTLLVSIFLILLFKPSFLADVGFQLSYVALFFILWLQPLFSSIWQPKNRIVKYLWDIVTVSFAAQIGAFPLSAYYFHQFAGLFFVTNLLIIPFLSIIMAIGVTVAILAIFGTIPFGLSLVLEKCIAILNGIIAKIASFDQFVIQDIQFNVSLLFATYLVIIAAFIWLEKPKFNRLCFFLVFVVAIQCSYLHAAIQSRKHAELVVFNWPRNTLIAENRNATTKVFSNDTAAGNNTMLQSYLMANLSSIKSCSHVPNVMQWRNKKILIIDSSAVVPSNKDAAIVLLIQSPKINLDRWLESAKPEVVIADASNYKTYIENWKRSCNKQKIPFHATGEKGFFRIK